MNGSMLCEVCTSHISPQTDRSSSHHYIIFLSFCSFSYSGVCSDRLRLSIYDVIVDQKKFQWRWKVHSLWGELVLSSPSFRIFTNKNGIVETTDLHCSAFSNMLWSSKILLNLNPNLSFACIGKNEMGNLEALCANMGIFIAGLDTYYFFELKGNLSDSTVWNTGEAGDILILDWFENRTPSLVLFG